MHRLGFLLEYDSTGPLRVWRIHVFNYVFIFDLFMKTALLRGAIKVLACTVGYFDVLFYPRGRKMRTATLF